MVKTDTNAIGDLAALRFGATLADIWRRAFETPSAKRRIRPNDEIVPPALSIRGRVTTVLSYEDAF